jgi:3-oxoacyl-[acyl-carrier-protein] synthase-1
MKFPRVVITGTGLACSLGHDLYTVTQKLRNQSHGFCRVSEYADFKGSKISIGTQIPGFDTRSSYTEDWTCPNGQTLKKETLRALNPHWYYGYHAVQEALKNAHLSVADLGDETGLFTASAGSVSRLRSNTNNLHERGVGRTSPLGIINSVVGTLSFNLSAVFSIKGAGCGFASACASSAHALGFALDQIRLGRQQRMIVVGAEDGDLDSIMPFAAMHALSPSTDPDAASLPFDKRRTGFVGSGGAATLILESLESATARGAPILAELLGWGQGSDGYKPATPHPEGIGLRRAMTLALKEAGLTPSSIDHINAHATGTIAGDIVEAKAIHSIFKAHPTVSTASTKSLTGHSLSMAGALEIALELLAQQAEFTPGTANLDQIDPECALINLPRENLPFRSEIIMSNSSGFGGANVSIIFKHWSAE